MVGPDNSHLQNTGGNIFAKTGELPSMRMISQNCFVIRFFILFFLFSANGKRAAIDQQKEVDDLDAMLTILGANKK
jgi:hypothetical protein